jgi:hypothetical protein
MKTYRVWIEVEEYDHAKDEYRNCDGLHFTGTGGDFRTERTAFDFAERLHKMGEILASTRKETNATKRQDSTKETAPTH